MYILCEKTCMYLTVVKPAKIWHKMMMRLCVFLVVIIFYALCALLLCCGMPRLICVDRMSRFGFLCNCAWHIYYIFKVEWQNYWHRTTESFLVVHAITSSVENGGILLLHICMFKQQIEEYKDLYIGVESKSWNITNYIIKSLKKCIMLSSSSVSRSNF